MKRSLLKQLAIGFAIAGFLMLLFSCQKDDIFNWQLPLDKATVITAAGDIAAIIGTISNDSNKPPGIV